MLPRFVLWEGFIFSDTAGELTQHHNKASPLGVSCRGALSRPDPDTADPVLTFAKPTVVRLWSNYLLDSANDDEEVTIDRDSTNFVLVYVNRWALLRYHGHALLL